MLMDKLKYDCVDCFPTKLEQHLTCMKVFTLFAECFKQVFRHLNDDDHGPMHNHVDRP